MSEDLFHISDANFREDVGRDDDEYSAYMAGFRSGVAHARRTPSPATAEVLRQCERRVNEGWLEIADLIMLAVAEWS